MVEELINVLKEREHLTELTAALRRELDEVKHDRNLLERQLDALRRDMERMNQTKQVVDLCKLILAGSLVPVASAIVVFALIDGSMFIPS